MNIFCKRLKEIRTSKNVTQNELAKIVNVSDRTIKYYESNDREPNIDKLILFADYFDVSLDYLVGRSDDPTRH